MSALRAFRWALALCALLACSSGDDAAPELDAATPDEAGATPQRDAESDADQPMDERDGSVPEPDAGRDAGRDASMAEPDASVIEPDAGPTECPTECPEGDERCHGGDIQECERGDDGCLSWQVERECESAVMLCEQTDNDARCVPRPPTCTDSIQNQDETDVDCGGERCGGCVIDQGCVLSRDCALGRCDDGACVPVFAQCRDLFEAPSGFARPHALQWPLVGRDTGLPRPAIGTTFGELQMYDGEAPYLHTGIDLRGATGDYVKVVADGNVWLTANLSQCAEGAGDECRLYIKDASGRYIYYYSHLAFFRTDSISTELRTAITNASPRGGGYDVKPGTEVTAGQTLSAITSFGGDSPWPHLHFGIFDATQNYDGINPLLALDANAVEPAIVDDEPPRVARPLITPDEIGWGTFGPCVEVTGSVDVRAEMSDSFYTTDPAPTGIGQITINGVYGARVLIRNLATGEVDEREWYEMDSVPFQCAGPLRGALCPTPFSEADFWAFGIDTPVGAPHVGLGVASALFDLPSSSSSLGGEHFVHVLTNGWGQPGAWNTTLVPDGLYQVSVEARDFAGNRAAASRSVVIDNGGTFDATLSGDAYVRDHARDTGAIPSSLGNAPIWASPDIFIVPGGTPVAIEDAPEPIALVSGASYDVYVRAHNASCGSVGNIRVRLSATAGDLILSSERVAITPVDEFVGDDANTDGLSLAPNADGLLGPFPFVPTGDLLAATGSCSVIAEIHSAWDPRAETDDTALDNNMAVRNVRVTGTTRTPAFSFGNDGASSACVQLVFESTGLPVHSTDISATLVVPSLPIFAESWGAVPGTSVEVAGDTLAISFHAKRVALPPITVPAHTRYVAAASFSHLGYGGARFTQYVGGEPAGTIELQ